MILGWILAGCLLLWSAMRHDKKMNENFTNFSIRADFLENRIQNLEFSNNDKDREIEDLEHKIRTLNEKIFELEKPYQKSFLDD